MEVWFAHAPASNRYTPTRLDNSIRIEPWEICPVVFPTFLISWGIKNINRLAATGMRCAFYRCENRRRVAMDHSIDETTHLSECGEALQQPGGNGEDHRSNVQSGTPHAQWYALHTYPRHEKRVHQDLALRAIESFLPLYET